MYTQCSRCETVFKLSAEALRAAGGQVRCGRCGEVFNALARLAEDPAAFPAAESSFDLETRADRILESVAEIGVARGAPQAAEEFEAPGVELAQLQLIDSGEEELSQFATGGTPDAGDEVLGDASLEFTLPPGELDRIFVESRRPPAPPSAVPTIAPEPAPPSPASPSSPASSAAAAEVAGDDDYEVLPTIEVIADRRVHRPGGLAVPEAVRSELLAAAALPAFADELLRRPPSRGLALWLLAAVAAALLLIAQVVHQNREWLATKGALGTALGNLYASLGAPIPAPANLAVYQLRQWGVTGDPDADGTLRVRASILNTAAQLEPYPLLRVTLANRFGSHLGVRDFEPAEYLGKPTAKLLGPNETVNVTLTILDPGKDAESFEIDVCVRTAKAITCAGDSPPATKP